MLNDLLKIEGADPPEVFVALHHSIFNNISHLLSLLHGAGNLDEIQSACGEN
jgi:hypothetical protein